MRSFGVVRALIAAAVGVLCGGGSESKSGRVEAVLTVNEKVENVVELVGAGVYTEDLAEQFVVVEFVQPGEREQYEARKFVLDY